jgi:hypothetical protein
MRRGHTVWVSHNHVCVHLSCSGNLLGDTALLLSLNETKAKALTVSAALADGKRLAAELDKQRSVYRPLAARGSALYFSMLQLRRLDNMYCFSLTVCTCIHCWTVLLPSCCSSDGPLVQLLRLCMPLAESKPGCVC